MKTSAKAKSIKKIESSEKDSQKTKPQSITKSINNKYIIAALIVVVLIGFGLVLKNQLVVATVNGKPIFRWQLISELEKQGGKQTLEGMVTQNLILQEAAKQNVSITQVQIDQEIDTIEQNMTAQGQKFAEVLAAQNMTRADLVQQIRMQKLVEALAASGVQISEAEIDTYLEENAENLPESTDSAKLREEIKQGLKQEKASKQIQTWVKNLQEGAKVKYFLVL